MVRQLNPRLTKLKSVKEAYPVARTIRTCIGTLSYAALDLFIRLVNSHSKRLGPHRV